METVTLALEVRIEKVDEMWDEFKRSQNSMYEFVELEGYMDPDPEFEEFESKYLMVKSILRPAIRERTTPARDQTNEAVARLSRQQEVLAARLDKSTSPSQQLDISTFLPKIRIEPFSGNYHDWPTFRDMFEGAVHNRTNISDARKFHLLKSSLRGDALNLLNHISISDATYAQALERLEKRYDRPRHIINDLIKTVFDLPSVHSANVTT